MGANRIPPSGKPISISLASGDVTLTASQMTARSIEFTGATAARTVTIPATATGRVTFLNSTAYTISIKRSGQTPTFALISGETQEARF